MPYTIDDVIYKLNQISNENEQFRQEMQRNNAEIIQELRCEINSLKNELGASRNQDTTINQSVAPMVTLGQPTSTASAATMRSIPRRPACTYSHGKSNRPRLLGYIRETMNLIEERNDSEQVKKGKAESSNSVLGSLEGMAKAVCSAIANEVAKDSSLDQTRKTWGKIPSHYKERGVKTLIETAKKFNFHLDRSYENWAPLLLLSTSYHNNFNISIPTPGRQNEGNTDGQTSNGPEQAEASESSSMANKRRRQETANERQSTEQNGRAQNRRRKQ